MPQSPVTTNNPQNEPAQKRVRSRSTFPLSHMHATTLRYSDIVPHMCMHGVEGDDINFNSRHELMSLVADSPILSNIIMHKDYFKVPLRAIMPENFELIYTAPVQGDDVPDDIHPLLPTNTNKILDNFKAAGELLANGGMTGVQFANWLRTVILLEMFYSDGSLLATLNKHMGPRFAFYPEIRLVSEGVYEIKKSNRQSYDQFVDLCIKNVLMKYKDVIYLNAQSSELQNTHSDTYRLTESNTSDSNARYVNIRQFVDLMRQDPTFYLRFDDDVTITAEDLGLTKFNMQVVADSQLPVINIDDVIAYQLICSHYFVNSNVDYVYSAELYRDLMKFIYNQTQNQYTIVDIALPAYSYNGRKKYYDIFSQKVLAKVFDQFSRTLSTSEASGTELAAYAFVGNLFGFRKSLKHGDYFTGARPNPLAVGNVNAPVVSNSVSAIDMTKNIMLQRFLNAVNRSGRKFEEYVSSIFGTLPTPDPTDPSYLVHDSIALGSPETVNTGANQGNITSRMRSNSNNFMFQVSVNEPCIIIGVTSFDAVRMYSQTTTRFAFHKNRYDMFNPFYQYIGDQQIYNKEKTAASMSVANFGYTLRHMEYKQAYSYASGGMVNYLPGYAFIADNSADGRQYDVEDTIGPEFIRSSVSELDRFFPSLTNISLSGYFHFIMKYNNDISAQRNMEYAPTIL